MERLSKIAIYLGMGIASAVFVLFLISILPHIVDVLERDWVNVIPSKSEQEIKEILYEHESYKIFVNKYPEYGEYYRSHGGGSGSLEVMAMNFETYNILSLELNFNNNAESINEQVRCFNDNLDYNYHVRGSLAKQFIEKVSCLEGDGIIASPSPLVDENGNPVPYMCGPGANYDSSSDVCVVVKKPTVTLEQ